MGSKVTNAFWKSLPHTIPSAHRYSGHSVNSLLHRLAFNMKIALMPARFSRQMSAVLMTVLSDPGVMAGRQEAWHTVVGLSQRR